MSIIESHGPAVRRPRERKKITHGVRAMTDGRADGAALVRRRCVPASRRWAYWRAL